MAPPVELDDPCAEFAPVMMALGNRMTLPFPEVLPILTPLFCLIDDEDELELKPMIFLKIL